MNEHKGRNFSNSGPFWSVWSWKSYDYRFNKCLSSSRCFHFNRELDKREEQQVEICQGPQSEQGQGLIYPVWTGLFPIQPSSASKATTSMKCGTRWARTCSTPWRRTTVWIGSAVGPCAPSASTSWTTSARRWSPSPGRSSACPASSPVVYKRWAEPLWLEVSLFRPYIWRIWTQISPILPHSWRCRLPPVTQWATSYNSGTLSPLNSSSPTSTTSRFWRSTGPSADGAASQRSTSRWVQPNTHIDNTRPPLDVTRGSVTFQ